MFDRLKRGLWLSLSLIVLIISVPSQAGLFDQNPFSQDGPLEVEKAFVFGHFQEGNEVKLYWDIPDDYYLYRDRIDIKQGASLELVQRINSEAEEKDDPLFGRVWVHHKRAEVDLLLRSTGETPVSDTLIITYQGCWEGGICYPPVTKELNLAGVGPLSPGEIQTKNDGVAEAPAESNNPSVSEGPSIASLSEQDQFAAMLQKGNLVVTLGAFFIAGLALSFTPCVFPMIPILSSIIAGQGRHVTVAKGFFLSLVYVLAVSVTYTLAGVFAGLFGENLQAQFQNPWIIGTFSMVFVLLALSMFGFYELQLPNSLQTRLSNASNSQKGGSVTGVAVMGFLSALIVGPCMAAPLAGALIYIGQTGDPILGGSALFSMSLGMGVPLLLVGASAGKLLPHAGLWMDKVKAIFGVLLLLLAIWMLDRIVPTVITMWLTAVVLIMTAVYMGAMSRSEKAANSKVHLAKGFGLIVLIYAVALMIGALAGSNSMLYPLKGIAGTQAAETKSLPFIKVTTPEQLDTQLKEAQQAGQPVMLDFYADWCVSCIELEVFTFADANVQSALKPYRVIKVDVTANDAPAKSLNKAYSLIGPPALIFYNRKGDLLPNKTLIGVVDPQDFVNHISGI